MDWIWIALIGPVLYAATNHIDKYLLDKYFKDGEVGALTIFSALFGVFALPVVFIVEPHVLLLTTSHIVILTIGGAASVACLILYLKALQDDEASAVVPFYQTIPVFGFILGFFVLRETLTGSQILDCTLIICGTSILSLDLRDGRPYFKNRVVALMLGASIIYAIVGVAFKMVALEEGFWQSIFWNFVGYSLVGFILFVFAPEYRRQFLTIFRHTNLASI